VLPVRVNEVTQVGPEAVAALFAYGAVGARFLTRGKPRHDIGALHRTAALVDNVIQQLGYGASAAAPVVSVIETDDPDSLRASLDTLPLGTRTSTPASFLPIGAKRNLLELSFRELHRAAPRPIDVVPLPAGAPFGGLEIDAAGCTLCLSCASACPTQALSDNPERPMLRFTESLCVQCGLCASTCPERVIRLKPQLDFAAWAAGPRVVKEEEPFSCISCGKPFGTRSTIERVMEKLRGSHWMFSGSEGQDRLRVLMMCEDCRVESVFNESFDPHAGPPRPLPRTTDDYLRARAQSKKDQREP
jgi:ferredoxin